ncbi:hypothetical protein GCM10020219_078740 [Nonomuraea dietziae]
MLHGGARGGSWQTNAATAFMRDSELFVDVAALSADDGSIDSASVRSSTHGARAALRHACCTLCPQWEGEGEGRGGGGGTGREKGKPTPADYGGVGVCLGRCLKLWPGVGVGGGWVEQYLARHMYAGRVSVAGAGFGGAMDGDEKGPASAAINR